MHLRTLFRTAAAALVVGVAAAALVACGGAASSEIPTTVASFIGDDTIFTTSDLTTSDSGATTDADGRPPGPPEEALDACEGLPEETSCSFTSPRDGSEIDGTCRLRRDDPSQTVCFPNDWEGRGPGQGRQGPPEESLAACSGITVGTACSFEAPFGAVEGTCTEGRSEDGVVACRPDWADGEGPFGPGGGPGGGPGRGEARAACEGLQLDAACSFEAPFGQVSGSCRTGRDGSTLVCAPPDWPGQ